MWHTFEQVFIGNLGGPGFLLSGIITFFSSLLLVVICYPFLRCQLKLRKKERRDLMDWYWWALIVIVLVAGATIKLKVLGKWLANWKKNEVKYSDDE
jgi:hypothetical protein